MAVPERASLTSSPDLEPAPEISGRGPRASLDRLAKLHAEATQTSQTGELLLRAPYAGVGLAVGSALAAALAGPAARPAALILWLLLTLLAAVVLALAYGDAIRAPLEPAPLARFSEAFKAVLIYAGIAWGAGAFLVLPPQTAAAAAFAFAAGPALCLALLLRARPLCLLFAVPSTGIAAGGLLLRGFADRFELAILTLLAGALIGLVGARLHRPHHPTWLAHHPL